MAYPFKDRLLSEGEVPVGTEYSVWVAEGGRYYRREDVWKLTSGEFRGSR